ncbi:hypothetical protein ACJRO7_030794 [Eucalyptus globulus]|uniref:Uncharacterized protein n=1 Tax=Eucalyptus globulus TaxID=34317 RepID=A0ABD3JG66_EUCGL
MEFLRAILVAVLVLLLLRFEPNEVGRSLRERDEYQNQKPHHLFDILEKGRVPPPGNAGGYTPGHSGASCKPTMSFAGPGEATPPVSHASDEEMVQPSVAASNKEMVRSIVAAGSEVNEY